MNNIISLKELIGMFDSFRDMCNILGMPYVATYKQAQRYGAESIFAVKAGGKWNLVSPMYRKDENNTLNTSKLFEHLNTKQQEIEEQQHVFGMFTE